MIRARSLLVAVLWLAPPAMAQQPNSAGGATAVAPATPPAAAPTEPVPALVFLKDGQQLRGKLVSRDATGATLELEGGARVVVPEASILRIELAAPGQTEVRSRDPNRTRYLYSPSGFMLQKGEGYVSQTELILTTVAYGLTDHVTVSAGTAIPAWFAGSDGINFVGTLKVGGSLTRLLHLAAGAQFLWLPGLDAGTTAGFLFGTATLGTPDAHVSVSAGPPFVTGSENDVGEFIFAVSGNVRVSERIALVSENWIVPGGDGGYALSGAVRFIGQRLGVDAGLIFPEGSDYPIPWLDFTFNFGGR